MSSSFSEGGSHDQEDLLQFALPSHSTQAEAAPVQAAEIAPSFSDNSTEEVLNLASSPGITIPTKEQEDSSSSPSRNRWARFNGTKNRLKAIGTTLQKANVAKWIDNLEKDQDLADELEDINHENQQECERREMMREAASACMDAIIEHLHEFLRQHPQATYEEWITDLHPENTEEGKLLEGLDKTLDHRFYVQESDHRKLWNENLTLFLDKGDEELPPRQFVPPRSQIGSYNMKSIDELLEIGDSDISTVDRGSSEQIQQQKSLENPTGSTNERVTLNRQVDEGDLIVFE